MRTGNSDKLASRVRALDPTHKDALFVSASGLAKRPPTGLPVTLCDRDRVYMVSYVHGIL